MLDPDVKFAKIDCATLGDNVVVAAQTNASIRVLGYSIVVDAAVDAAFRSNTTPLTGGFGFPANGGAAYAGTNDSPAFQTARGEALNLNLSAGVQASGHVTYKVIA